MKKKFRNITVDDKSYTWSTQFDCDGDGNIWVKIWELEPKKKNIFEAAIRGNSITPSVVARIIKAIKGNNIRSIQELFVYDEEYERQYTKIKDNFPEEKGFFERSYYELKDKVVKKVAPLKEFFDSDPDAYDYGDVVDGHMDVVEEFKNDLLEMENTRNFKHIDPFTDEDEEIKDAKDESDKEDNK